MALSRAALGATLLPLGVILGCAQMPPASSRAAQAGAAAPATVAPGKPAAAAQDGAAAAPSDAATSGSSASTEDPLPSVELSGALLFEIIAAEIAQQRGDAGDAYATMLKAARDTRDQRLARRATEIALNARASTQALESAQLWSELAPHSVEATQTVAALLIAVGRFDDAAPRLALQIRAAADPPEELARVQRLLTRAPDRVRAFALLDQLAAPYLDDPATAFDTRLVLANGAHAAGLAARTTQETDAALRLRPDSERAAMTAAQFMLRGDGSDAAAGRTRALEFLRGFVNAHPKAHDARGMYARLLVADGELAAAKTQFEVLLHDDDRQPDTLYALGLLALETHERGAARGYLLRYIDLAHRDGADRDTDGAYLALARVAEEDGKFDDALRWLDHIEGSDQAFNARLERARLLGRLNRIDEGRKLLNDPPPVNDDEATKLTLAEGQLLRDAHRYTEWSDLLERALLKQPEDPELLYEAGMAAERLDRIDAMEAHLRLLMRLRPDYAHAYNALGYSFADRNLRLTEALDLINQALKLSPDDGFIIDSLGWVQFKMGQLHEARTTLERAYQLKPEADVAAHLGEVMWSLGERDDARRIWREARQKETDNETLKATLQRLKVRLF